MSITNEDHNSAKEAQVLGTIYGQFIEDLGTMYGQFLGKLGQYMESMDD